MLASFLQCFSLLSVIVQGIFISIKMRNYATEKEVDIQTKQRFHHVLKLIIYFTALDILCFASALQAATTPIRSDSDAIFRDRILGISAYLYSPMIFVYVRLFDHIKGIKFYTRDIVAVKVIESEG
ncbi:hypothetical protein BC833DRAFT_589846 [Globomyces pollinis-pini]|nr:hypothetical protein BC833DRAFT_589846 [Globomyces pollinis-pini]